LTSRRGEQRADQRAIGSYARTARINELLREILADELERLSDADDRLRLATVTGVDVVPDLGSARVYMGSMTQPVADALAEHRVQLQRVIGRQVRLKRTPKLQFSADPAVAEGERVEEILRRIKSDSHPEPDDGE
jgi:ribosome-binding factor A